MSFVYISTLFFAFVLSLAPAAQYLLDPIFGLAGVSAGYKTPLIDLLIFLGMIVIVVNSPGNHVIREFVAIFKWWIPWLIYLLIRSNFDGVGIWKFEMYIARLLIPTAAIALVYLAAPERFERYFFGLLLVLAIILIPSMLLYDFDERDFFSNIWLSRTLAICTLYLFINIKLQFNLVAKVSLMTIFIVAMFLIGSRGPFLALLLTATTYFMLKNRKNYRIMFGGGIVAVIIAVVFIQFINISSIAASFLTHGKSDQIENIQDANDRSGVYAPTFEIFAEKPIFGVGLGLWSKVFYDENNLLDDGEYKYPHSFLLEVLSELGIVGLVLYILLFRPLKRMFSLNNKYNIFILLGLVFATTSSDLTQNSAPLIFCVLSFIYIKLENKLKKDSVNMPVMPSAQHNQKIKNNSVRLR